MANVKLAVIYYSATGTNYQLSQWAAEGAKEAGAEVRVLKVKELAPQSAIEQNQAWKEHMEATKDVPEVSHDDLEWADAIIFSMPTRYGNIPAQMKEFIDGTGGLWFQGKLANKVVSAMTSAQNPHGGQEATLLALYTTMHHWGAIVAAPGYTDQALFPAGGNPYGTSATTTGKEGGLSSETHAAVIHQAKRTVTVAKWVKQGLEG
ncbi:NAD(P)H dehydrogenase (quinone) [Pontibacter ummariensis]|uniref:NAD(P)H dehydrogenase (Quinone) n=1 Tax=Pontibacter ummariensis TaxID=1610492 RepID=A0A239IA94_9BACT|nr:NAD(P)H:quinone oxidoreductase [Pontibacter ummariensis]PRY09959.1 NAD(P)H dehydrogenase (quinone) [Pontibacter ummariensis]SNS90540.1 NAD(P)H dehydrogenase (quinone) [Pontibacter ummariensis]